MSMHLIQAFIALLVCKLWLFVFLLSLYWASIGYGPTTLVVRLSWNTFGGLGRSWRCCKHMLGWFALLGGPWNIGGAFGAIWRCLQPFECVLRWFGAIWRCLQPFGALEVHLEPFGGVCNLLEVFATIWCFGGVLGALWRCLEVIWGIWRQLEHFGGVWRSLEGIGGLWASLVLVRVFLTQEGADLHWWLPNPFVESGFELRSVYCDLLECTCGIEGWI
jgi:hypothetical protein